MQDPGATYTRGSAWKLITESLMDYPPVSGSFIVIYASIMNPFLGRMVVDL